MPTGTFFRLPEEKRARLLDAAWKEFTRVKFSDASINQIIRTARIPRGSFYQYFEDKEDLLRYLAEQTGDHFARMMEGTLLETGGDLFAIPLNTFDRFVQPDGDLDPILSRCIQVLRLNRGIDLQSFLCKKPSLLPDRLWEKLDLSGFRRKDRDFAENTFFFLMMAEGHAIMETQLGPEQRETQRRILGERVELIKYGCLAPGAPGTGRQGGE